MVNKLILIILLVLCSCSKDESVITNRPINVICGENHQGTFVATGPFYGLTASHTFSHVGEKVFIDESPGRVDYFDPNDLKPAVVSFPDLSFSNFYYTDDVVTGTAIYKTVGNEYLIDIKNDRVFYGREPIDGDSGSPVLQNNKLVGIVTHSINGGGLYVKVKD